MEVASGRRPSVGGVSYRRLLWAAPLAGIVAAACNAVLWLVARALGAMPQDLIVNDVGPITVGPVMAFSFVPALFAGVLLALLARVTRRPLRVFTVVAAVVLVLSFVTPFSIAGAPLGMVLALEVMHVVAAVVIVVVLTRFARR
jgi:hypothetical protein